MMNNINIFFNIEKIQFKVVNYDLLNDVDDIYEDIIGLFGDHFGYYVYPDGGNRYLSIYDKKHNKRILEICLNEVNNKLIIESISKMYNKLNSWYN